MSDDTCTTKEFVAFSSTTYPDLVYIEAPPFSCDHNDLEGDFKKKSVNGYAHCIDRALSKQKWPVELNYNLILYVMKPDIVKYPYKYGNLGSKESVGVISDDKDENGTYCGYRAPFVVNYEKTLHLIFKRGAMQSDTNPQDLINNIKEKLINFWPNMEGPYLYVLNYENFEKQITELPDLMQIEKIIYDKASHTDSFMLHMDEKEKKKREKKKENLRVEESAKRFIELDKTFMMPRLNRSKAKQIKSSFTKILKEKWSEKEKVFIENFVSPGTMEFAFYLLETEKVEDIIDNVRTKILEIGFKEERIDFSIKDLKSRNFFKVAIKKKKCIALDFS